MKKINNSIFTSLSIAFHLIFTFAFPHTVRQQAESIQVSKLKVDNGNEKPKEKLWHMCPFGATFVCQAGNFWTLLRIYIFL